MKIYKKALSRQDYENVQKPIEHLPLDNIFGGGNLRLAIPLNNANIQHIISSLENGDTKTGTRYIVDKDNKTAYKTFLENGNKRRDPRPLRLGKVIGKEMGQRWLDIWSDESSGKDNEGKSIIVSRSPVDVVRMSDHDNWTSCHSPGDSYYENAIEEAVDGGGIAYVVENEDLNNFIGKYGQDALQKDEVFKDLERNVDGISPLSRIRINRYVNSMDEDEEIAIPTTNIYGEKIDGFKDTLTKWLKEQQSEDIDYRHLDMNQYKRTGGSYADNSDEKLIENFFGDNMGVSGDLMHQGGQRRLKIWQDELMRMNEMVNEPLRHSSVYGHADEMEGNIYITASGEIEFKFRGKIDENLHIGDIIDFLKHDMEISDYCGYPDDMTCENKNGIAEIYIRCILDEDRFIENPDEFESLAQEYEDYEDRFYEEDAMDLYNHLIDINKITTNDSILDAYKHLKQQYKRNNFIEFDEGPGDDIVFTFPIMDQSTGLSEITPSKFNEKSGVLMSSEFRNFKNELINRIRPVFHESVKKHVSDVFKNYWENKQTTMPFYQEQGQTKNNTINYKEIIPNYQIGIDINDFTHEAYVRIVIPKYDLYRLGRQYVKAFVDSCNKIQQDLASEIKRYCTEHNLSKESGINWYSLCKIGQAIKKSE